MAGVSPELLDELKNYLELVRKYYVKLYNKASSQKDAYISSFQAAPGGQEAFVNLKRQYYNESLTDFVRNTGEVERITEYKGRLIQKIDPIFLYPDTKFVKAHFYSPVKPVFGKFAGTFWVNVAIIWISNILLYLILYYRLLKRFLEQFDRIGAEKEAT